MDGHPLNGCVATRWPPLVPYRLQDIQRAGSSEQTTLRWLGVSVCVPKVCVPDEETQAEKTKDATHSMARTAREGARGTRWAGEREQGIDGNPLSGCVATR